MIRLFLATILVAVSSLFAAPTAASASTNPAIYLVPHQDDEVLTMGADLEAHINAGRDVIIVMVTDGAASAARTLMCNAGVACLSKAKFSDARDREFIAAMVAMGVPRANLYFENQPDGGLTLTAAKTIVNKWAKKYPGASIKTMSKHDAHPDHSNLGLALESARASGVAKDARFLQYRAYWTTKPVAGWFVKGNVRLSRAIAQYELYSPKDGRYAIGPKWSVPGPFRDLKKDPRSKIHQ